jgi:hypothetical protein
MDIEQRFLPVATLIRHLISSMVIFFPSLFMVCFGIQSMAPGLIVGCTIILFVRLLRSFGNKHTVAKVFKVYILLIIVFLALIILHYIVVGSMFSFGDTDRFFASLIALVPVTLGGVFAANYMDNNRTGCNIKVYYFISFLLIINGAISIIGIDLPGFYSQKPMLLFYEPSHFALICAPFLMTYCALAGNRRYIFIVAALAWAIYVQSLLMVIISIVCLVISARTKWWHFLGLIPLAILFHFIDTDYFSERLLISSDSENLSVMVFLQGWENARIAFVESWGLGVGFQQFGISGNFGAITDTIEKMAGFQMNLLDGGTTASKVIGEFGIFGMVLLFLYLAFVVKSLAIYRLSLIRVFDFQLVFCSSCVISYGFELFLRGVGYFSAGFFLFVFAVPAILGSPWQNNMNFCEKA